MTLAKTKNRHQWRFEVGLWAEQREAAILCLKKLQHNTIDLVLISIS